jgi:glycosyltransferase involved in cell wall biosynthesis
VVLVAQRLDREKETAVALRAWAASRLADDDWRMEVAGSGAERAALEELVRQLDLTDSVSFLGLVDDLPQRLADAGVFLATTPVEAFGLAVAEAMASGVAVVAAAGGAHAELLGVSSPGLFVVGEWNAAAERLRAFTADGALRLAYGEALRGRQQSLYSIKTHVASLVEVYEDLAGL